MPRVWILGGRLRSTGLQDSGEAGSWVPATHAPNRSSVLAAGHSYSPEDPGGHKGGEPSPGPGALDSSGTNSRVSLYSKVKRKGVVVGPGLQVGQVSKERAGH
jgi:hypothetical protein